MTAAQRACAAAGAWAPQPPQDILHGTCLRRLRHAPELKPNPLVGRFVPMTASLAIEQVHSSDLSAEGAAAVCRLCDAAYGCPTQTVFTELGAGEHLLGFRAGILLSHLMWVRRWLQPDGQPPLRTAYVEMVATHPAEQGQRYATRLLEHLVPYLIDYELAALCPATEGLYRRLGWRFWRGPLFVRKQGRLIPTPEERVMILPVPRTPPLSLDVPLSVEWRPGEVW